MLDHSFYTRSVRRGHTVTLRIGAPPRPRRDRFDRWLRLAERLLGDCAPTLRIAFARAGALLAAVVLLALTFGPVGTVLGLIGTVGLRLLFFRRCRRERTRRHPTAVTAQRPATANWTTRSTTMPTASTR